MKNAGRSLVEHDTLRACGVGRGDCVLAAISGGADSTALIVSMAELWKEGAIAGLYAAHLNHGIRAQAADADEAFCGEVCASLGVPLTIGKVDVPAYARENGLSLESAARTLRYAFLFDTAKKVGAECVMTAHNACDQAETLLMHLLRGCATAGLAGMKPRSGALVRPLLGVTRAQIETFLCQRGVDFRQDETNFLLDATRNRVRHTILPLMEAENPSLVSALCRTARLCAEDEAYLEETARRAEAETACGDGLDKRRLAALERPIAARVVKKRLLETSQNVTEADVTRVLQVLHSPSGTHIELASGRGAWTDANALYIGVYPETPAFETPFIGVGETITPAGTLRCTREETFIKPAHAREAYFDMDMLPEGLCVRTRRKADRIYPLGAPGERLLSDVLIDRKIPREKRGMPLLCKGGEVYWAVGVAVSEKTKVTSDTRRILHMIFT